MDTVLGSTSTTDMKIMELQKRVSELEYRQVPKPEEIEKLMELMTKHGVTEFNYGMVRISKPWQHQAMATPL